MDFGLGFTSQPNAQDVIGFFHHNISQHTKEIAVINTTLADLSKNKIDNHFKNNVAEFMEHTEVKMDRLSTSFKLLTKQVFHNDASIQNILNSNLEKNEKNIDNSDIETIKNNQNEILERLSALENASQRSRSMELTSTSSIVIYDSPPAVAKSLNVNKVYFDPDSSNANKERDALLLSLTDRVSQLEQIKESLSNNKTSEIDDIKTYLSEQSEENNKKNTQKFNTQQKSINDIKNLLVSSQKNVNDEITNIKRTLEDFMTRDEFTMQMQGQYNSYGRSRSSAANSRPSTAFPSGHPERFHYEQQVQPTVSFTMISGDNLTRPSTTQHSRTSHSKKIRSRGYK